MGARWKEYVKQGKWIYEDHAFWISGYTFWALKEEGELESCCAVGARSWSLISLMNCSTGSVPPPVGVGPRRLQGRRELVCCFAFFPDRTDLLFLPCSSTTER